MAKLEDGKNLFQLHDKTPENERGTVCDAFNTVSGFAAIFASTAIDGLGHNLQSCHYAFLLEPLWEHDKTKQAFERFYRNGQQRETFCYHFVMCNTMEEKVFAGSLKKRVFCDALPKSIIDIYRCEVLKYSRI
jgi:SNF2 family DNA or RNA helicase